MSFYHLNIFYNDIIKLYKYYIIYPERKVHLVRAYESNIYPNVTIFNVGLDDNNSVIIRINKKQKKGFRFISDYVPIDLLEMSDIYYVNTIINHSDYYCNSVKSGLIKGYFSSNKVIEDYLISRFKL